MDKPIDYRRTEDDKVYCTSFHNYSAQVNCVGFMPFIRGGGCTFNCSGSICRWKELIPEKRTVMVYIVGRLEPVGRKVLLAVDDVFDDYSRAFNACTTKQHFIGPLPLNETLPTNGVAWPGMHYPKRPAEWVHKQESSID